MALSHVLKEAGKLQGDVDHSHMDIIMGLLKGVFRKTIQYLLLRIKNNCVQRKNISVTSKFKKSLAPKVICVSNLEEAISVEHLIS